MKESPSYQAILKVGRAEGSAEEGPKDALACDGRLVKLTVAAREALAAIESLEQLSSLISRLFAVETWDDLLATDDQDADLID